MMNIDEMGDEYLCDIFCLLPYIILAASMSLVNRRFYRIIRPIIYEQNLRYVQSLMVNIWRNEDINGGSLQKLIEECHCQKVNANSVFDILIQNGIYITNPPPNIRGFNGIYFLCNTSEQNFLACPKLHAFLRAFHHMRLTRQGILYHLHLVEEIKTNLIMKNSNDLLNQLFGYFVAPETSNNNSVILEFDFGSKLNDLCLVTAANRLLNLQVVREHYNSLFVNFYSNEAEVSMEALLNWLLQSTSNGQLRELRIGMDFVNFKANCRMPGLTSKARWQRFNDNCNSNGGLKNLWHLLRSIVSNFKKATAATNEVCVRLFVNFGFFPRNSFVWVNLHTGEQMTLKWNNRRPIHWIMRRFKCDGIKLKENMDTSHYDRSTSSSSDPEGEGIGIRRFYRLDAEKDFGEDESLCDIIFNKMP